MVKKKSKLFFKHHIAKAWSHLVLNETPNNALATHGPKEQGSEVNTKSSLALFLHSWTDKPDIHSIDPQTSKNQAYASGLFQCNPPFLFGIRFEATPAACKRRFSLTWYRGPPRQHSSQFSSDKRNRVLRSKVGVWISFFWSIHIFMTVAFLRILESKWIF